jgi:UDP-glucose 4-epimerase
VRIAVTGGCGFIGSHLVPALLTAGHDVVVVDSFQSDWPGAVAPVADIVELDVRDEDRLTHVVKGRECIVHLASSTRIRDGHLDTRHDWEVSLDGCRSALEAARRAGVERFVFASSGSVYGASDVQPLKEDAPLRPASLYAASKVAAEAFLAAYAQLFPLKATILRLGNVLGPGLQRGVVNDFVERLRANPTVLRILGNGEQRKSYVDIEDCVSAFLALGLEQREGLRTFNVASGDTVAVREIAELIIHALGLSDVEIVTSQADTGWPGDVPVLMLSSDAARAAGWAPHYSAREAIARMAGHLLSGADARDLARIDG